MKKLILIGILVVVTLASAKVFKTGRIVGGDNAVLGQFPYQVSIRYEGKHGCGGAILDKRYIVTAAHCVSGTEPKDFKVVVGTVRLEGGVSYDVESYVVHEDWQPNTNDIAIIKVSSDIAFNENTQPIPLSSKSIVEEDAVVSGWGMTAPESYPINLKYLKSKTITTEECIERHGPLDWTIDDNSICTTTPIGQGTCFADSGGPLVVDGELAGVVCWGRPCGMGYPDVFMRVSKYKAWIEEQMK